MNSEEIKYFDNVMKDAFKKIKNWESDKWVEDLIRDLEKEN